MPLWIREKIQTLSREIRINYVQNYINIIRNIIAENYQQSIEGCTDDTATNYDADATVDDGSCDYPILGDINDDAVVNVQDIIILVNMILAGQTDSSGDLNSDGLVNILDVVQVVNIILS